MKADWPISLNTQIHNRLIYRSGILTEFDHGQEE
jgi:hypothetical protein